MDRYEGVEFGDGLDELVTRQLQSGIHRHKDDSGPGDWLLCAWEAISPTGREKLALAVHRALLNESLVVRLNALGMLDAHGVMVIPEMLLDVAVNHFDLYRGLRRPGDPPEFDRGKDLVRLTAAHCEGKEANLFRRRLVLDKDYGNSVLSNLARREPAWVLKQLKKIINPGVDPQGERLRILVHGLKPYPVYLQKVIGQLLRLYPQWRKRLQEVLDLEFKDKAVIEKIMSKIRNGAKQ